MKGYSHSHAYGVPSIAPKQLLRIMGLAPLAYQVRKTKHAEHPVSPPVNFILALHYLHQSHYTYINMD